MAKYRKKAVTDGTLKGEDLYKALSFRPRVEKMVIKDAKLRSFITSDDQRDSFVSNLYDTTYEVINKGVDNIVIIDDSIVRGNYLGKKHHPNAGQIRSIKKLSLFLLHLKFVILIVMESTCRR